MNKPAERLLSILAGFSSKEIIVIGDLIADEFLYGQISRVSREAPVLVLHYRDLVRLPGGAANAANNLLDLGCKVRVIGLVGQDEAGRELFRSLARKGARLQNLRREKKYATPVKTRILAGAHHSAPQQIVRVDRVPPGPPDGVQPARDDLAALTQPAHGIILSDYGYGMATPELSARLQPVIGTGVPLVVDSRFRMADFCGVTSITPNITELEAATGISIGSDTELLHKIGQDVMRRQKLGSLLVTQGRFGMTLFQPRKAPLHIPVFGTDEVADVTGAGDTVIAVFTLAQACAASPEEAARLANYAGGIVVMKRGTATVTRAELAAAVEKDPPA